MTGSPKLLGIVNVTEDSFSDGGQFLDRDAALAHARTLAAHGADVIDLGAAASNPDARPVSPELEIERLAPLVDTLVSEGLRLSIDSCAPETQCWAISHGVKYLNDIHGFAHPKIYPALAASQVGLIMMHALRWGPAKRDGETPRGVFDSILAFFESRIASLCGAGIDRRRLILDPQGTVAAEIAAAKGFRVLLCMGPTPTRIIESPSSNVPCPWATAAGRRTSGRCSARWRAIRRA